MVTQTAINNLTAQTAIKNKTAYVREALNNVVPETPRRRHGVETEKILHKVMRKYLLRADGNFMPSVLCSAACELVGGRENIATPAACAIAMVDTIRVINRELLCMNKTGDDTNELDAKCREAMVILASGALIARAFSHITTTRMEVRGKRIVKAVGELSKAAATLAASDGEKVGEIYECSAVVGAIVGGGSEDQIERMRIYGRCVGRAVDTLKDAMDELMKPRSEGEDAVPCFDGENVDIMPHLTNIIACGLQYREPVR